MGALVGLCGDIDAGKDTAAKRLIHEHGFRPVSLAKPLKEAVYSVLRLASDQVEWRHVDGTAKDKAEPIPDLGGACGRDFLEGVGTEGFRGVYDPLWLQIVTRLVQPGLEGGLRFVVSDVRFLNEIDMVRSLGGEVWHVVRDGYEAQRRDHASDQEWRTVRPDRVLASQDGDVAGLVHLVDLNVEELLDPQQAELPADDHPSSDFGFLADD